MHVDFKITTWERVEVPPELEEVVTAKIKAGVITCSNDIWDILNGDDCNCNIIDGTSEQMSLDENDGFATIEIFDDTEQDPLYKNGE